MLKEKIKDVLETLTERERQVLELRFGLVDGYSRTLEEVGRQFNVTRERIRQIEAKALRKMRHPTRIRQLEGFLEAADLQTVPKRRAGPCRLTRAVVDNAVPIAVDHHRSRINDRTAIDHTGHSHTIRIHRGNTDSRRRRGNIRDKDSRRNNRNRPGNRCRYRHAPRLPISPRQRK